MRCVLRLLWVRLQSNILLRAVGELMLIQNLPRLLPPFALQHHGHTMDHDIQEAAHEQTENEHDRDPRRGRRRQHIHQFADHILHAHARLSPIRKRRAKRGVWSPHANFCY